MDRMAVAVGQKETRQVTVAEAEMERHTFTWEVVNFASITDRVSVSPHWSLPSNSTPPIQSNVFTTGDKEPRKTDWTIVLYPCLAVNHTRHSYNGVESEFVAIKLDTTEVSWTVNQVKGSMSLINADGEQVFKCKTKSYYERYGWDRKSLPFLGFIEFDLMVVRENVFDEEQRLLKNGVLTIECDIEVRYKTVMVQSTSHCLLAVKLSADLTDLLASEKYSDVVIRCKGAEFRVHKAILSSRSPFFARMFEHEDLLENQENAVDIPDINGDVMRWFLHYLYGGEVRGLPPDMCLGLYAAADKYGHLDLLQHCSSSLAVNLNVDMVCEAARLGYVHEDEGLFAAAKRFARRNATQLMVTGRWVDFVQSLPEIAERLMAD